MVISYAITYEDKMRALIDIPKNTIEQLDVIATEMHISRAELIRQAIHTWLDNSNKKTKIDAFGMLKNAPIGDGVDLQISLRSEW